MTQAFDIVAIGNAIVDVIAPATDAFLETRGLHKGSMALVDQDQSLNLYAAMAPGIETSGGSAANSVAGIASLGARAGFIGKVASDQLGDVFEHDMRAGGVAFNVRRLADGPATARSLINVTPDGQRTMSTFLGASIHLSPDDVDADMIEAARIVYLEGYLFDAPQARRAFAKAAGLARANGVQIALTMSDGFVVERHRQALLEFVKTEIDIVFANENEVCALFETPDVDEASEALAALTRVAAVTRGAKGAWAAHGETRVQVPAITTGAVVDTTGAGDQFAAGFLTGLAREKTLHHCCQLGVLAAGEVIGHYGPRPQANLFDLAQEKGLLP